MPRAESAPSEGAGCWEDLRQPSVRVPGRRPRALLDSQTHRDLRPTFALPMGRPGSHIPLYKHVSHRIRGPLTLA